jgi:hypothetical protein
MKKTKAIILSASLIVSGSVLFHTPKAAAFSFGSIVDTVTSVAGGIVGDYLGTALSGYLDLGLQNLNKVLGIKLPNLTGGDMGLVSLADASTQIEELSSVDGSLSLDLNPIVDGKVKKGEFNINYGRQITEGILGKEAQSALKKTNDSASAAAQGSSQLAQAGQKDNVTQTIQKKVLQQNAVNANLLSLNSQKLDMTNTQLAGANVLNSTTADVLVTQEKRQVESDNAAANYSASSTAFTSGIYQGLGGDQ